ncbi:hypothetical protein IMSAGC008_01753 [Muribaculaceae bacterium]|nr:hypothetical protein IMSAGC008_01753 [Muribaculaceae bacterium]
MKLLRALFYQYYWWQMRKENDESFVPVLAVLCLLVPLFGIVGFIAIFADVIGLVILQKYDIKMTIFAMFILGLAVSWWLFLRRKQYKTIAQEHDIYDKTMYQTLAILYPILSAILFFIGLYIGYLHNSEAEHIESIHIRAEDATPTIDSIKGKDVYVSYHNFPWNDTILTYDRVMLGESLIAHDKLKFNDHFRNIK